MPHRPVLPLLSYTTLPRLAIRTISFAIFYSLRHTTLKYDRYPVVVAARYQERYAISPLTMSN